MNTLITWVAQTDVSINLVDTLGVILARTAFTFVNIVVAMSTLKSVRAEALIPRNHVYTSTIVEAWSARTFVDIYLAVNTGIS